MEHRLNRTIGFFQLMRPANIVTSVADVLAGIAVSGILLSADISSDFIFSIILLCLSTIGLYGGGVVFNDVFDAALDMVERPERPIPRGIVTTQQAALLGIILLVMGVTTAFFVHVVSGLLASLIAAFALIYDKWGKHHPIAGPLNMGLCRGLNLLLGISILVPSLYSWWYLCLIPVMYIAAITMVSRGEVHGGRRDVLYFAAGLYTLVIFTIFVLSIQRGTFLMTAVFLLFFAWMIFSKLATAIREPLPPNIGKAVKAGVIALIIMNAAWASAFGAVVLAFIILLLLPISLWLAKKFAVT